MRTPVRYHSQRTITTLAVGQCLIGLLVQLCLSLSKASTLTKVGSTIMEVASTLMRYQMIQMEAKFSTTRTIQL